MTQNVIRVSNNGTDGRYVIGSDTLTLYKKGFEPVKLNVKRERALLDAFLRMALAKGKAPTRGLLHTTDKNKFIWGAGGVVRVNKTLHKTCQLGPKSDFTLKVVRSMVLANVV